MADNTTPQPEPGDQPRPDLPKIQIWPAKRPDPNTSIGPLSEEYLNYLIKAKPNPQKAKAHKPTIKIWPAERPDPNTSMGPITDVYVEYLVKTWMEANSDPQKASTHQPTIKIWPVELPGRHPVREKWRDSRLRQVFAASGLKLRGLLRRVFVAPRLKLRHQETKG